MRQLHKSRWQVTWALCLAIGTAFPAQAQLGQSGWQGSTSAPGAFLNNSAKAPSAGPANWRPADQSDSLGADAIQPLTPPQSQWQQPQNTNQMGQSGWQQPQNSGSQMGQSGWQQPQNSMGNSGQMGQSDWQQGQQSTGVGQSAWQQPNQGGSQMGQSNWQQPQQNGGMGQSAWQQPNRGGSQMGQSGWQQPNQGGSQMGQSGWQQPGPIQGQDFQQPKLLGEVMADEQQAQANGMQGGAGAMGGSMGNSGAMGGSMASGTTAVNPSMNSMGTTISAAPDPTSNAMNTLMQGNPQMQAMMTLAPAALGMLMNVMPQRGMGMGMGMGGGFPMPGAGMAGGIGGGGMMMSGSPMGAGNMMNMSNRVMQRTTNQAANALGSGLSRLIMNIGR